MIIYTCTYRNSDIAEAQGCEIVNISTMSREKNVFTPPADLLNAVLNRQMERSEFDAKYLDILRERYRQNYDEFRKFLGKKKIALVCSCRENAAHCHRYAVADVLQKICEQHNVLCEYRGEVRHNSPFLTHRNVFRRDRSESATYDHVDAILQRHSH